MRMLFCRRQGGLSIRIVGGSPITRDRGDADAARQILRGARRWRSTFVQITRATDGDELWGVAATDIPHPAYLRESYSD
jgi:hypothetical protein